MKKKIIMSIAIILTLILGQGVVKAASPSISVSGNNKVKAGSAGVLSVEVTSGDSRAAVMKGKIEVDSKIETLKDTDVTGKNGWEVTYNPATGDFNVVKAAGASNDIETCLNINYTIKSGESGTANIKITNLEVGDMAYKKESVSAVSKDITIEAEAQTPVVPDPGTNGGNNQGNNGGVAGSNQGVSNNKKDGSTSKTKMPQTGDNTMVILGMGTFISIVGIVAFIQYKRTY